ncbi:MAG TPA: HAMP domain-containing sensor histidine kinase, partial [Bacilli bacterium]
IIHDYKILSIWVGPYILAGSILLIHSYYKEKNPFLKRSRKFLLYMALPPVLFQLFSNYILRMLDVQEAWRFNAVMICILFVIFIVFLTKYDVFGIKVKFEKQRLDSTIRALTSGTTLVNHSIKNEVGKMNLLAVQLQYKANEKQLPDLLEDIDNILISTDHLLGMANRVQHHMRDIILKEDFYNLHLIIEESLELINPYIKKQNIQVLKDYPFQADLLCDKVLIQEMFSNLFTNSIEAMKENGRLEIQLYDTKKNIVISVKDNGSGISKENLPHVMDPFFSTKRRSNNFGLGLSYCYNVIQKHHGNLELYSDVNVGTTIMIHYPKKKVKSLIAYSKEVGIGGKDQSLVS